MVNATTKKTWPSKNKGGGKRIENILYNNKIY